MWGWERKDDTAPGPLLGDKFLETGNFPSHLSVLSTEDRDGASEGSRRLSAE